jgi:tetratricopeptide (TPR) repeat protein
VQAAPRNGAMWRNLAAAYYRAPGERPRAPDAYRRSAALLEEERRVDPKNAEILAQLADDFAMLGQADAARRLARDALASSPSADDLSTLVGAFEQLGDRPAALQQARAAVRAGLDPHDFELDPALDSLRKDPRYAALVTPASKGKEEKP